MEKSTRFSMSIAMALLLSLPSFAQYGGGMGGTVGNTGSMGTGGTTGVSTPTYGSSGRSYGNGKAIGIGVGAAAAGAAGLYLLMHRASSVTGCVQPADDGLRLVDDKGGRSFSVVPSGAALVPGQHVQLRGKIVKERDGAEAFEAKKLVRDLGTCGSQSGTTQGGK